MSQIKGKTVLITGASSGIGAALAREYGGRGANLVLTARRLDRLKSLQSELEVKGIKTLTVKGDVTQDGDLERVVQSALNKFGKIDTVIANAGFGVAGDFENLNLEDYRRQFETNLFGVLRTCYASLEELKKSRGTLVLIGSVAGYIALPGGSPYSMSKFAIRALADSLYSELEPLGISVVHIAPGFIESEFRQIDNSGNHHANAPDPISPWIRMPTIAAAQKIANAIERRNREYVVTGHGKILVRIQRFIPWIFPILARIGIKARKEPT